jgi:hypothetical protein
MSISLATKGIISGLSFVSVIVNEPEITIKSISSSPTLKLYYFRPTLKAVKEV